MKLILFAVLILSSGVSYAQKCEELIHRLDPKAPLNPPLITVGKLKFQFVTPGVNPTSSCSIKVTHLVTDRSYTFMDDGSLVVMDNLNPKDISSKSMRAQSYMMLPQEKGKNFTVTKNGNLVSVRMNAGEFIFDTVQGKLIPSSSLNLQDTPAGVRFIEPKALVVDFGTMTGRNPKEAVGATTVMRTGSSSCQFNKTDLLDSSYDKNIKVRTQSSQLDFFRRVCVGTRVAFQSEFQDGASASSVVPSRNFDFDKAFEQAFPAKSGAQ